MLVCVPLLSAALSLLLLACAPPSTASTSPLPTSARTESGSGAPAAAAPWDAAMHRVMDFRVGSSKLGTLTLDWQPLPSGGYRLSSTMAFAARNTADGGDVTRIETHEEELYAPDLTRVRWLEVEREGKVAEREETWLEGSTLKVRVDKPSHHLEQSFALPADYSTTMKAFVTLRAAVLTGAPLPRETRYSSFDVDDLAFHATVLRLIARTEVETPTGPVSAWDTEAVDLRSGDVVRAIVDEAGLPLRIEFGAVTMALQHSPDTDEPIAEIDSTIPVAGGYDASAPELRIQVTVSGDDRAGPDIFPQSPYQTGERRGGVYDLTLHSRRASHGLRPASLPMQGLAADLAKYLAATSTSQSGDPLIVERTRAIVGAERDSRRAARSIVSWVFDHIGKDNGVRGGASAVETLRSMKGDCTEHAALVVALARAAGIPARYAHGIVLVPGRPVTAGYHAWAELWIGEWVVMDAALGTLDAGPSYLWIAYDEPNEPSRGMRIARLLGRTSIVIR